MRIEFMLTRNLQKRQVHNRGNGRTENYEETWKLINFSGKPDPRVVLA